MVEKAKDLKELTKKTDRLKNKVESGKGEVVELGRAREESDSRVKQLEKALIKSTKQLSTHKIKNIENGKVIEELEAKVEIRS